jgi:aminopeptidase N/puromycin-sensitive aminopeptidase
MRLRAKRPLGLHWYLAQAKQATVHNKLRRSCFYPRIRCIGPWLCDAALSDQLDSRQRVKELYQRPGVRMTTLFRRLALFCCLAFSQLLHAQRLPDNVIPESYELTVAPDLERATFTGEETIHVRLTKPTATIVLNSAEIEFREVTVAALGATRTARVSADDEKEQVTLSTDDPIPAGLADVHIQYSGILNNQLRGFYLSQTPRRRYAVTQFEATDARRAFPSFDEPGYKAVFRLTLILDTRDTAISAGRIVSDTPGPGESKHTLTFSPSPKMSTYLMSIIVGDFDCREGGADGIPIRVCAVPEKSNLTSYALVSAENLLKYFDTYFDTKYPFEKLDIIAFPDFSAGAMENTAAITYRETLLLIDEKTSSRNLRATVPLILAHEMAHQWFGDLVTMRWWEDVWLNEGFATWMSWKPVEAWKPDWHLELGEIQETNAALDTDAVSSIRAIRAKAETPAQIATLFDGIAYGKAASVLRMMESYLGPESFRKGVNAYLRKFAYGNASAEDFWNELATVSGKPVDKIMATFIDQPGGPLVSVNWRCHGANSTVTLTQQRYFNDSRRVRHTSPELWQIPVSLEASGSKIAAVLLTKPRQTVELPGCPSTIFADVGGTGYYRPQYAPEIYPRLIAQLDGPLSGAERIRFLGDAWALVDAGQLDIATYLSSIERLRGERRRAVVAVMLEHLDEIHEHVVAAQDRNLFEQWVRSWLRPVANDLRPEPTESDERRALRSDVAIALADVAREPDAIQEARVLAESYMKDASSVSGDAAAHALQVAAENGNATLFDRYVEHLTTAETPAAYYAYLGSLPLFSDPALLPRIFDFFLSPAVRVQDVRRLNPVLLNEKTQPAAWELYKARFPEIQKKAGASLGSGLVAVAGVFCDPRLRDDSQQFFVSQKIPGAERLLKNALDQVNACIQLQSSQQSHLSVYLRKSAQTAPVRTTPSSAGKRISRNR